MAFTKAALTLVLLAAISVHAAPKTDGYQYPKPSVPFPPPVKKTPTTPRTIPTKPTPKISTGYEYPTPEIPFTPDHAHHEPGMPFAYKYAVKDDSFGTDFSENADSNGDVVRGEYRVALPDGRLQIVRYTADWKNGYNAEVTYEGTAVYPEEAAKKTNGGY